MEMEKLVLLLVGGVIGFIASIAKDYFVEKTKKKIKTPFIKLIKSPIFASPLGDVRGISSVG